MIRLLDILASFMGLLLLSPVLVFLLLLGYVDNKSPIFMQTRVGKNKKPFTLIKFRTMHSGTKSVASHMVDSNSVTKLGSFLRKSKLDELPQLINVLKGDMSLVGPRPNLYNQKELINERELRGVYNVRPGITGLAQINNVDMSTPKELAMMDSEMLNNLTVAKYIGYIFATVSGKGTGDAVKK